MSTLLIPSGTILKELNSWKTPVTEQRQDEPDSDQQQNLDLRNMYNALRTEETASDTSETAMASAPGALGAQEAQKARLRLVTALIVNRIQLAGDELSSTSASSTGLRHSAWAAEGAGAGQVEMQRRSQWAQTMAEHAEHLNFPEFAVALYGQSLSINRALKETCQVHFPFGYCAKIETQYSRALLSAGREEELRARLSDLTQLIDSYASGDATQIRDADALYCARRDVGSLLLHAGDRDGAEKYLREALFKGGELEEREGEPPNNDETRNLIMLIFRVYEDPVDIAAISKMRAFKDRIPGLLGPTLEAADLCKALDWCEANGFPPLNHASLSDREKDLLLHSHVDNDGRLPIHIAAMDKHIDPNVLQTLTSGGAATLDQVDNFGRTPLMLAVESSNCEAVHRLLHAGASVLVRREADGMTALHMCQNRDVLKSLLDGMNQRRLSAASIVMNNEQQRSQSFSTQPGAAPLLWRSRSGPPTSSAPVEAATSDIDVRDLLGKTPLHYACRLVDHDLAAQLLQYGANPNVVSDAAESPFMVACLQNKKLKAASQIATVLVQYGARVDKPEIWKALGKRGFPKKDMDALRKGKAKGRMSLG